jgi:peptidoglycan/xylan/chitin deacetylase (PgdA/CDA1 family)
MNLSQTAVKCYYLAKPFIPRALQLFLRRKMIIGKRKRVGNIWPILEAAGEKPENWKSWPDEKKFALILTHDVDTARGQDRCRQLMEMEISEGFRSSFNFVPERYPVSADLRQELVQNGFEVGVHGLNHDGKLYSSREIFLERATKINRYLQDWDAVGFRSPSMHHNLEWIHDLKIKYDCSTFDTDPFQPQPDGVETIFPFCVPKSEKSIGYIELPYTLPQDFVLFVLLNEKNIDIWKTKLDWIAERGGMALINTHPDYMNFDGTSLAQEDYPAHYYMQFLQYIKTRHKNQYWHALPKKAASFTKSIDSV